MSSNEFGYKLLIQIFLLSDKEVEGQQKSSTSFASPLTDLKVEEGVTFRLEAIVCGNPLPDIQWLLDDQPLSCSDTISLGFDGKKVKLTFKIS